MIYTITAQGLALFGGGREVDQYVEGGSHWEDHLREPEVATFDLQGDGTPGEESLPACLASLIFPLFSFLWNFA